MYNLLFKGKMYFTVFLKKRNIPRFALHLVLDNEFRIVL